MGFSIETGIPAATVFIQGLLSFFSPCVLPLVPLYLGYLSGGISGADTLENPAESAAGAEEPSRPYGRRQGKRGGRPRARLFLRVLMFSVGIGAAFFILGAGASAVGRFFQEQRTLFARLGGVLVIFFGLYQLGVFGNSKFLGGEHRLPFDIGRMTMSPVTALLMGFLFSFAWTPCVGPALTSVLLMAGSARTSAMGFLLIGVYTLGFILPFLAAGIFTARVLGFFRRHARAVRYTVRIGGVLMILMGVFMFTGKMNDITGYLSTAGQESVTDEKSPEDEETAKPSEDEENAEDAREGEDDGDAKEQEDGQRTVRKAPLLDMELTDQYGNTHTLSQYNGKVIFLNFWATWCGPCRNEMPDIQKLYEEYSAQGGDADVVILGVAGPLLGQEGSSEDIAAFMEENGYTYPVLMDESAEMFSQYGISAFPTTFMIDRDGGLYGYVPGQMTEDIMRDIIEQTLESGL